MGAGNDEGGKTGPRERIYDAFISYRHHHSTSFAERLEMALKRYGKPLFQRPRRIFRDEKHLVPGADLPRMIRDALDTSDHLILLASPEAAASQWVEDEVAHWCSDPARLDRLIIVLTSGQIISDLDSGSIQWERTDALPPMLSDHISSIPLFVDLSWATSTVDLDLTNPRFRAEVNRIVARFEGKDPNEMAGEGVLRHRKNLRLRRGAITALTSLTLLLLVATGVALSSRFSLRKERDLALSQKHRAEEETRRARAALNLSGAQHVFEDRPDIAAALLLSVDPLHRASGWRDLTARSLDQASRSPVLHRRWRHPTAGVSDFTFSDDATFALIRCGDGSLHLWDLRATASGDPPPVEVASEVELAGFLASGEGIWLLNEGELRIIDTGAGRPRAPGVYAESHEPISGTRITSSHLLLTSPEGHTRLVVPGNPPRTVWAAELGENPMRASVGPGGRCTLLEFAGRDGLVVEPGTSQPRDLPISGLTRCHAFDPYGYQIAVANDRRIAAFECRAPERAVVIEQPEIFTGDQGAYLQALAFQGSSGTLAVVGAFDERMRIRMADPYSETELEGTGWSLWEPTISPSGRWMAMGNYLGIRGIGETHVDRLGLRSDPRLLRGESSSAEKMVFSDDERYLATLHENGSVFVWELERELLPTAPGPERWAFDTYLTGFGSDGEFRIFVAGHGACEPVGTRPGATVKLDSPASPIHAAAVVRPFASPEPACVGVYPTAVNDAVMSERGDVFFTLEGDQALYVAARDSTGEAQRVADLPCVPAAIRVGGGSDTLALVTCGPGDLGRLVVASPRTGEIVHDLDLERSIRDAHVSRDGHTVLALGHDQIASVWKASSGSWATIASRDVDLAALSPDGRYSALVRSGRHSPTPGEIVLHEGPSSEAAHVFPAPRYSAAKSVDLAFLAEGRILGLETTEGFVFWEMDARDRYLYVDGGPGHDPGLNDEGALSQVTVDEDGERVVILGHDNVVRIQGVAPGDRLWTLGDGWAHSADITIDLTPDSTQLAVRIDDHVQLWPISDEALEASIPGMGYACPTVDEVQALPGMTADSAQQVVNACGATGR